MRLGARSWPTSRNNKQGEVFGYVFCPVDELQRHTLTFEVDGKDKSHEHIYPIDLQAPGKGIRNPNRRDILDTFHENGETTVIGKSFGEFLYRMLKDGKLENAGHWLDSDFEPVRKCFGANMEGPICLL